MRAIFYCIVALLVLLAILSGAPLMAQSVPDHAPNASIHRVDTPASNVTLMDALRHATKRDATNKGRHLLVWMRQRAGKHLKVTVH